MKIHKHIGISEAKLEELQKAKKKDVIDFLKGTGVFGGISKKHADAQMEKVYDKIKSWRIEKKVGTGDKGKNTGDDRKDNT